MDDIKHVRDTDADDPIVRNARHGERLSEHNDPDSFPEEGTDDKMVQHADTGEQPFSDDEAVRATKAVIASGLSGHGKVSEDTAGKGPDDGTEQNGPPGV